MPNAIYTSLSGMTAFRTGLDAISNNVANMNTPGFKLSDPLFRDLLQREGEGVGAGGTAGQGRGAGVDARNSQLSFAAGDFRDTGNSLDVSIDGAGMFVLDQDGRRVYTRAGQFKLDDDGVLVERDTGAKVLVSTETNALGFFDIDEFRVFPPKATKEVTLAGVLARGGATTTYELPQITVIDTSGAKMTVKARFNRDAADPLHWNVEIVDDANTVLGSGDLRFNADGTPADGASSITVTVTPTNSTPAFDVLFNFGAPGTYGGVTSIAGTTTSTVQMLKQDGAEMGSITKTEFDEHGQLQITYSNGEKKSAATLVLALFNSTDELVQLGGARFAFTGSQDPMLGSGLQRGLGRVQGSKVEMSNVDLTNQFTNLILVQRGFQGSSQITQVANEMLQQLLAMAGGNK